MHQYHDVDDQHAIEVRWYYGDGGPGAHQRGVVPKVDRYAEERERKFARWLQQNFTQGRSFGSATAYALQEVGGFTVESQSGGKWKLHPGSQTDFVSQGGFTVRAPEPDPQPAFPPHSQYVAMHPGATFALPSLDQMVADAPYAMATRRWGVVQHAYDQPTVNHANQEGYPSSSPNSLSSYSLRHQRGANSGR